MSEANGIQEGQEIYGDSETEAPHPLNWAQVTDVVQMCPGAGYAWDFLTRPLWVEQSGQDACELPEVLHRTGEELNLTTPPWRTWGLFGRVKSVGQRFMVLMREACSKMWCGRYDQGSSEAWAYSHRSYGRQLLLHNRHSYTFVWEPSSLFLTDLRAICGSCGTWLRAFADRTFTSLQSAGSLAGEERWASGHPGWAGSHPRAPCVSHAGTLSCWWQGPSRKKRWWAYFQVWRLCCCLLVNTPCESRPT